ncbi:MAG TPA: hypothetical protein VF517_04830 [Thermoleophilaceae bacterium]|jgi:hypothetical protein
MARLTPRALPGALGALMLAALIAVAMALPDASVGQGRDATTTLFSRTPDGNTPNGPSTNPHISADLRYSQIVAYESEASDLVARDTNGLKDVFAVRRAGSFGDTGSAWTPGKTQLVSRSATGKPANGPSFDATTDGSAKDRARCVAFLSDASNLVSGDTNGQTDAFLAKAPKFVPTRVSLPKNKQSSSDTTHVAVSGDCSKVAFVSGGGLYVRSGKSTKRIDVKGAEADPSYDTGDTTGLVFGASGGVYLLAEGASKPTLVAKGGRNPGFIQRRRQGKVLRTVIYETDRGGFSQIGLRSIGGGERIVSSWDGDVGNGDSREPSIFNAGFNAAFVSDASNLPIKSSGALGDRNGLRDAYFWSGSPNVPQPVTILESVDSGNDPLSSGAEHVSTSYYRNYVVFDSAANRTGAEPQIWMRYLGGI